MQRVLQAQEKAPSLLSDDATSEEEEAEPDMTQVEPIELGKRARKDTQVLDPSHKSKGKAAVKPEQPAVKPEKPEPKKGRGPDGVKMQYQSRGARMAGEFAISKESLVMT